MKESIFRNKKSLNRFLEEHAIPITRVLLVVLFFMLPFVVGIPLSGVPISQLKVDITPLGYPIEGDSWDIMVWGKESHGVPWEVVENANITVTTQNDGTFQLVSDIEGKASFQYFKRVGTVSFYASHEDYGAYEWVPQESFVDSNISLFVIGIFGIGTFSGVWEILSRNKRRNKLEKVCFYALLIMSIIGLTLSFLWFMEWKLGTKWGFGNTILAFSNYRINFDPHLWIISLIVLVLTFLNLILTLNLFHKSDRKSKKPDYVV